MWSTSGDEGVKLKGVSTISLGRLQYITWVTAGPTQKTKIKKNLRVHAASLLTIAVPTYIIFINFIDVLYN
jgi:hypothetical protein